METAFCRRPGRLARCGLCRLLRAHQARHPSPCRDRRPCPAAPSRRDNSDRPDRPSHRRRADTFGFPRLFRLTRFLHANRVSTSLENALVRLTRFLHANRVSTSLENAFIRLAGFSSREPGIHFARKRFSSFDAFSSCEPVSTSLENALVRLTRFLHANRPTSPENALV